MLYYLLGHAWRVVSDETGKLWRSLLKVPVLPSQVQIILCILCVKCFILIEMQDLLLNYEHRQRQSRRDQLFTLYLKASELSLCRHFQFRTMNWHTYGT
jgi:hypothetical protein